MRIKSREYLNELRSKFPNDELTLNANMLIDETETSENLYKGISANEEIIEEYSLLGNYPNPFNPSTNISYSLPYESEVELKIYDIMGREVKSFTIPSQSSGYQRILWDGTNENGIQVASGIYIYRIMLKSLENNEMFVKTAKLMMLK